MARDGLVAVALAGLAAWAGAPAALPTLIAGAGVGQVVIAATGWGAGRAAWLRVVAGGTMLARAAVLAPLYLAVMTPLGLGRRALGADPLDIRRTSRTTGWHERGQDSNDPVLFERLY